MTETPLLERELQQPIAWLSTGIEELNLAAGAVSGQQFVNQVIALAEHLPAQGPVINLCHNRYLFLLGLCAAVVKGQTCLLPPNKRASAQQLIAHNHKDAYVLHSGTDELADLLDLDIRTGEWIQNAEHSLVPNIERSFPAVVSYTSGSTGDSKPNLKTWHTLRTSTLINARYMLPKLDQLQYHLATVPGQHMWGLETSVIMALFAPVCIADSQPLFPADVQQELLKLPSPKALISTPFHLRSLRAIDNKGLNLDNVLCATAPLSQALAQDIEQGFDTTLREVYGCSEVGSMAVRRTAENENWLAFDGFTFHENNSQTIVSAEHLPADVRLEDSLVFENERRFRLQERNSDAVKVAGKRGSLKQINQLILDFPGVVDAAAFLPPQDRPVPRVAALVVFSGEECVRELLTHLRNHLDAAFVPRPLLSVPSLPREENGKLGQARLLKYFNAVRSAVKRR